MLVESLPSCVNEKNKAIGEIDAVIAILDERKKARALRRLSVVNFVTIPEIERWLKLGVVGRFDLPSDEIAIRRAAARAEVEHLMSLVEGEPMGIQIALLEETLPNITFQLFRSKRQTSLGLSPFRLGGELPNIRLGLAMVTSDAQAVELYEKLADDLWRCAHKGSDAVKRLKAALDRSGIRQDKRALTNRGRSKSRRSGCESASRERIAPRGRRDGSTTPLDRPGNARSSRGLRPADVHSTAPCKTSAQVASACNSRRASFSRSIAPEKALL